MINTITSNYHYFFDKSKGQKANSYLECVKLHSYKETDKEQNNLANNI